jgi:glyoxylase-like metal-dependent hydrolase (beta-lactamase superfamily II)
MKVIDLGEGLLMFMFDPPPGEFEGLNLLALVDGDEALLLDAGYKDNLREALAHLEDIGARPVKAVISHYHPDHADGLALIPDVETWGHAAYQETLDLCFRPERHASLEPRHAISAPEALAFGSHRLELIPMPGHTPDSLCVAVDGRVMYAADLLLFTNEGAPVLPSVHARPVSLHADALRKLWHYLDMTFVPGHGAPMLDRTMRERDLANRISYVDAIAAVPGIGLDDAQRSCSPRFLGSEWHEENRT